MKRLILAPILLAACQITLEPAPPPHVHMHVGATWRVLWVEYYVIPETTIVYCDGLGWHDDDLSVALFLAHHAHVDVKVVVGWRTRGLTWWDVSVKLGLGPDMFYVAIPDHVHVGPPYGNAYGYYRKRSPSYVFVDADVVNLVHLKVTSVYYNLDPVTVIKWREGGKHFGDIVHEHHGRSRGKDAHGRPVRQDAPKAKGGPPDDKGKGGPPEDKGGPPDDKGKGGPPDDKGGKGKGKDKDK
jgi:hypothetical protein